MIAVKHLAAELQERGYVYVNGVARERLERVGVPIYVAPDTRGGAAFNHVTLAPGWATRLVKEWPIEEIWDTCLRRVVEETFRRDNSELAEAAIAAAQLGGVEAVYELLGLKETP